MWPRYSRPSQFSMALKPGMVACSLAWVTSAANRLGAMIGCANQSVLADRSPI